MKKRITAKISFYNNHLVTNFNTHFLTNKSIACLFVCLIFGSCGFSNHLSNSRNAYLASPLSGKSSIFFQSYTIPTNIKCITTPVSTENVFANPSVFTNLDSQTNQEEKKIGLGRRLVNWGRRFLGIRYRRAGKTPRGFDCSGFTRYVFAKFGMRLPPNSHAQSFLGQKVDRQDIKPGDLVFFGYKSGRRKRSARYGNYRVSHAAIAVSLPGEPLRILHSASGKGIMITTVGTSRYWTRRFLFAKSILKNVPKNIDMAI